MSCQLVSCQAASGAYSRQGGNQGGRPFDKPGQISAGHWISVRDAFPVEVACLEKLGKCGVLPKANPVIVGHGLLRQFAAIVRGRVPRPAALPQMQTDFRRTTVEPLPRRTSVRP